MNKQVMVIGLGQFGMSLARTLASRGVEVLAVDDDQARVEVAARHVLAALCLDATNEQDLAQTTPDQRDVCVCAIGTEAREGSIICTALLRQMGAPHIVARAADDLHERILRLVGAHEVVNPEQAYGERLATRLLYTGVIDEVPLGLDLVITELRCPSAFAGRSLVQLELPRRFRVTVVAVQRPGLERAATPSPHEPLAGGDVLVIVAPPGAVARMLERVS
jgi:trk system potassium uptake protein TrkA